MIPRMQEKYRTEIVPKMMETFGFKNVYQVPHITKVVVNIGLGEAVADKKIMDGVAEELGRITGQKPLITLAKKDIANFKIRKGVIVGCKVTLRKAIMYEFLDRFINVALPRIRDFRGVSGKSFDESGNYSMGITEQGIFPEIDVDKIQMVHGMDITIVTNGKNKKESFELLRLFGMPFKR